MCAKTPVCFREALPAFDCVIVPRETVAPWARMPQVKGMLRVSPPGEHPLFLGRPPPPSAPQREQLRFLWVVFPGSCWTWGRGGGTVVRKMISHRRQLFKLRDPCSAQSSPLGSLPLPRGLGEQKLLYFQEEIKGGLFSRSLRKFSAPCLENQVSSYGKKDRGPLRGPLHISLDIPKDDTSKPLLRGKVKGGAESSET